MTDRSSDLPHQKPTVIAASDSAMAEHLSRRCAKDHDHQRLEGSNAYGSRCRQAETHPMKTANLIAAVAIKQPMPEAFVNFTEVDDIRTEAFPGEAGAPERETNRKKEFRVWRSEHSAEARNALIKLHATLDIRCQGCSSRCSAMREAAKT